jgi:hypothetical protein
MDFTPDTDMSSDYETLIAVMDDHAITEKQLTLWTGLSRASINRYKLGQQTIPSIVWRVLYSRTHDVRVLQLLTGLDEVLVIRPQICGDLKLGLKTLLQMRQQELEVEQAALDILADGKIDISDHEAIQRYKMAFPKMIGTATQLYGLIIANERGI